MDGLFKRLLRLVMLAWIVAWVGGVIGAFAVKRRTVVHDDPEADEVVLVGVFGPLEFTSLSQAFRGGTVETWFGGGVIDLREAVLDPDGADLTVRAVFGGGQILVPDDLPVSIAMRGLGGMVDGRTSDHERATGPELRIDATVLLGGFSITSVAPDLDETDAVAPWRAVPIEVS